MTRISDSFPVFTVDRDPISYDPNDPRNIERRRLREARKARVRAKWGPYYDQLREAAEGLTLRLVNMHRPLLDVDSPDDPPECSYCTSESPYGYLTPLWPCPETRVLANELGVELPPDEEDWL